MGIIFIWIQQYIQIRINISLGYFQKLSILFLIDNLLFLSPPPFQSFLWFLWTLYLFNKLLYILLRLFVSVLNSSFYDHGKYIMSGLILMIVSDSFVFIFLYRTWWSHNTLAKRCDWSYDLTRCLIVSFFPLICYI